MFFRSQEHWAPKRRNPDHDDSMVEMHGVNLVYPNGFHALHDIELLVGRGEFVFLVGTTGSGKSSLLKLVYREHQPRTGAVYVDNEEVTDLKRSRIPYLRRKIGVIFQDFRLLPNKTAWENVAYALEVTGARRRTIPQKVARVLELVGLLEKRKRMPSQLSGGEQQRVAIARALVNEPILVLADEPTGNLDPESSWDIMQILSRVNSEGTTVMVATHDQQVVDVMKKRVLVMRGGRISDDLARGSYAVAPRATGGLRWG
ncbi:MAG: cell division ATP-binding protein FtsE [Candidatus Eremiobacterota bacterium]